MESSQLYIDTREEYLKKSLSDICIVKQLDLGDICIIINNVEFMLIERKTMADLMASIIDGRYKDQKARLLAHHNCTTKIAYIIEGYPDYTDADTEKKITASGIINTIFRDNIPMFFTRTLEETSHLTRAIYTRVSKDPLKYAATAAAAAAAALEQAPKKSRGDNCFRDLLCQIPGLSLKTANMLVEKYQCFATFYAEFQKDADQLKVNNRRLSKTVISNIEKYLYKN